MIEDDTFDHLKYKIVDDVDGSRRYFNGQGKLHREDGPAVVWAMDGGVAYYHNGKMHREDGPAVITAYGDRYWYINNFKYTEAEFNAWRAAQSPAST